MPKQPLGEVFGYPIHNQSPEAERNRDGKLCPFNNKVAACTKVSVTNPLGVCSVIHGNNTVITCPVRFRQSWRIADDAAAFFFPAGASYERLTEIRITDGDGLSAGNIDIVLVSHDGNGRLVDFGSLEVQAVYISGNVKEPFDHYMASRDPDMDWTGRAKYPRPDYLSSSRKRLAPQILYKGSIIKAWGRKQAVALQSSFFQTLPELPQVPRDRADIAWLIYDLAYDSSRQAYDLVLERIIYSTFDAALHRISTPRVGPLEPFVGVLQTRLNARLKGVAITDASPPLEITDV